jgi:hypothetical protein
MGIKFTNNASATLAASINSTVTSISVTTGQGARFPTLAAGDYFFATLVDSSNNLEIIKVTNRVTDTMTVVRAQDGTTGRSFLANDRLELRPVAASFNALQEFTPSGTIAANTLSGAIVELDSEKAPINSPTFTGTPAAPTATAGTNTTQLATTAFTTSAVSTAVTNERSATVALTNKTITGANNTLTVRLDQTDVVNTLPVVRGGTGQSNSYTNGDLLIGNTTGNTLARAKLTAGNAISITNGAGSITIDSASPNSQRFFHQASQPQTFTIPSGITRLKVTVVGGGGCGGAFYNATYTTAGGGGGGGGGAAIKWLSGLTPGNTLSVTVGGASAANSSGNTSSVASGTQSITTISATGGAAGGSGVGTPVGGSGGLGSNGDLNIAGSPGGFGFSNLMGMGGSSILGGGGASTQGPGSLGRQYGGGGSGGGAWPTADGLGAAGVVIIEW